ncbi:hypothetical protein [Pantoea pleuroti]|uniref:hypothetical protein n=1 Tax=Pantoea pleuroti TaxID=1592631 RepID=UPI0015F864A8|nr:hypothetical protein [Pantoea pleuroti]MBB1226639.1 hypothetical protein [Pantoea pleuroti]
MTWPSILISVSVISFLISIVLQFIGYIIFRKNAQNFESLISEFRKRRLDLDFSTQVSSFLSPSFHPVKISWFARLYKGVKLQRRGNESVSQETYDFIQSLPEKEIGWLIRLHTLNMVTAVMMIGGGLGFIIWRHFYK